MSMKTASLGQREIEIALFAGAALLAFVAIKGLKGAAAAAGSAVVDAATGAVVGVVDATGQTVGLPPLSDITTDAGVSRWIIDNPAGGQFEASRWSSASAYAHALFMDAGSGTAPPPLSKIAQTFPPYSGVSGDW
jgi:hypothetical protein